MPLATDTDDDTRLTRTTTVAIFEDQQVLAGAIRTSLDTIPDLECVGTATTIAAGAVLAAQTCPDVLLADYRLADGDIADHLSSILATTPGTRVLVYTGWPDESSFLAAMAAGAAGFIDKGSRFDELVSAIRRVAGGEVVVAPRFLPALTRRATGQAADLLSRRELEVLQLLAEGYRTEDIADRLIVAVNTVRNHIARLMNKLEVSSRIEAVHAGVRRGLVRVDPPT